MRLIHRLVFAGVLVCSSVGYAQNNASQSSSDDVDKTDSPLRILIERFARDNEDLSRYYNIRIADDRRARMQQFYRDWEDRLAALNFDSLGEDGQVDYVLFHNFLDHSLRQIDFETHQSASSASYVPFAGTIIGLEEARRNGHPVDSQAAA